MDQLVRKNSIQAAQLTSMEKALRDSTEYIGICEDRVRKLESVRKLQSYDADAAFHRSLTNATPNTKNEDDMMVRLKDAEESLVKERFRITEMEKEMRSRERQHKLSETNAIELRSELQKTKALLQSTQHAARLTPKSSGAANSHAKLVAGLKSEICSLRAYLNSYQMRLESSKKTQRALVIRVGALEDQLDNMPPSIKYTDLELKVLTLSEKLRNENSKLHKDSPNPVAEISQDDGRRSDSEYDFAGPFFSDDSYRKEVSMMSCHDSHVEKEHQITSNSTLGLTRIESETGEKREKPFPDADATKLKNVMKERDVLLEFIQVIQPSLAFIG